MDHISAKSLVKLHHFRILPVKQFTEIDNLGLDNCLGGSLVFIFVSSS